MRRRSNADVRTFALPSHTQIAFVRFLRAGGTGTMSQRNMSGAGAGMNASLMRYKRRVRSALLEPETRCIQRQLHGAVKKPDSRPGPSKRT
jgi:hypothetical protein